MRSPLEEGEHAENAYAAPGYARHRQLCEIDAMQAAPKLDLHPCFETGKGRGGWEGETMCWECAGAGRCAVESKKQKAENRKQKAEKEEQIARIKRIAKQESGQSRRETGWWGITRRSGRDVRRGRAGRIGSARRA